jgi:crotonobetainyl-CoA:carnitine CoA-transferase CaiB-like acyl-CoA transferase
MRFSETPVEYEAPPPLLGQHTREVLSGVLGMSGEEMDRLAARKIT